MKYKEMQEREAKVEKMIEDGMIMADMARELGITPQSVQKFLRTRGWQDRVVKGGNSPQTGKKLDPKIAARKEARKEARKKMTEAVDRSGAGNHKAKTT